MNRGNLNDIIRFVVLVLFQALALRQIYLEWDNFQYVNILIYPLFIFLLPLGLRRDLQFFFAFLIGITVDLFYDSPGVHASAAVFTIYLRPYVLSWLEPRAGYNANYSPTVKRMGFRWYIRYISILLFAHCVFYFSVEVFTPVLWKEILKRIGIGFSVSLIGILITTYILNTKD